MRIGSGVAATDEFRGLQLLLPPGCRQERGTVRVGREALEALLVPVEDPPDPVALVRVAEEDRSLRAVLLANLHCTSREERPEAVDVLDPCRCEQHLVLLSLPMTCDLARQLVGHLAVGEGMG